jgi:hypothetical protein
MESGWPRVEAVRGAASRFRSALEHGGLSLPILATFPAGSCGAVSGLLGQYLIDSGLGDWWYRMGSHRDSLASHAWLEQGGLTLDITADQFSDVAEPVILTARPAWHRANFIRSGGGHVACLDWYESCDMFGAVAADYAILKHRADSAGPGRARQRRGLGGRRSADATGPAPERGRRPRGGR